MNKLLKIGIILSCMVSSSFAIEVGKTLPHVTLEGKNGGLSNNRVWDSKQLKGKVHLIIYMDPDERKTVMPFLNKLNSLNISSKSYSTVAIVNLAATWMPNALLEGMLSKKQKELKNTIFVFDKTKYLLKKWHLKDNTSNILVIDKKMKLLYKKSGKLSSKEQEEVFNLIKKSIRR